jgi:hypothetical protein
MSVLAAKVDHTRVDSGQTSPGFLSIGVTFFLARQRTLSTPQFGKLFFEIPGD